MNEEDFPGLDHLKSTFRQVSSDSKSYKAFYENAAAVSSMITLLLMQCGCVGERLPRNYRVIFHPEDSMTLLLQKYEDPWNERQMSWYNLNARGDEMPPRKILVAFEQDLRTGWLDELANMLDANAEENDRVAKSLKQFGRDALGDGTLSIG